MHGQESYYDRTGDARSEVKASQGHGIELMRSLHVRLLGEVDEAAVLRDRSQGCNRAHEIWPYGVLY